MTYENYQETNPNKYQLSNGQIITEVDYESLLRSFSSTYKAIANPHSEKAYGTESEKEKITNLYKNVEFEANIEGDSKYKAAMEFDKYSRLVAYTHWNPIELVMEKNRTNAFEDWFDNITEEQKAEIRKQNDKKVEQQILKENEQEEKLNNKLNLIKEYEYFTNEEMDEIYKMQQYFDFGESGILSKDMNQIINQYETAKNNSDNRTIEKLEYFLTKMNWNDDLVKLRNEKYDELRKEYVKLDYCVIPITNNFNKIDSNENIIHFDNYDEAIETMFSLNEKNKNNTYGISVDFNNGEYQNGELIPFYIPGKGYNTNLFNSDIHFMTKSAVLEANECLCGLINYYQTNNIRIPDNVDDGHMDVKIVLANRQLIENQNKELNKEIDVSTNISEKDNKRILELSKKVKQLEKTIQKQNQLLYGETKVEVNGVTRTCPNGIVEGFAKSVARNDEQNQRIIRQNQKIENLNNYIDSITNPKDSINPNKPEPKDPKSPGDDGMSY